VVAKRAWRNVKKLCPHVRAVTVAEGFIKTISLMVSCFNFPSGTPVIALRGAGSV